MTLSLILCHSQIIDGREVPLSPEDQQRIREQFKKDKYDQLNKDKLDKEAKEKEAKEEEKGPSQLEAAPAGTGSDKSLQKSPVPAHFQSPSTADAGGERKQRLRLPPPALADKGQKQKHRPQAADAGGLGGREDGAQDTGSAKDGPKVEKMSDGTQVLCTASRQSARIIGSCMPDTMSGSASQVPSRTQNLNIGNHLWYPFLFTSRS